MANRNTAGFGLKAGTVGATPATAGQGKYLIDAGITLIYSKAQSVQSTAGYIGLHRAAITNTIGVLNGIFYNAATTKKPTFDNYNPTYYSSR